LTLYSDSLIYVAETAGFSLLTGVATKVNERAKSERWGEKLVIQLTA
jgi:hypothetical protein